MPWVRISGLRNFKASWLIFFFFFFAWKQVKAIYFCGINEFVLHQVETDVLYRKRWAKQLVLAVPYPAIFRIEILNHVWLKVLRTLPVWEGVRSHLVCRAGCVGGKTGSQKCDLATRFMSRLGWPDWINTQKGDTRSGRSATWCNAYAPVHVRFHGCTVLTHDMTKLRAQSQMLVTWFNWVMKTNLKSVAWYVDEGEQTKVYLKINLKNS